jgi:hypothetical protein
MINEQTNAEQTKAGTDIVAISPGAVMEDVRNVAGRIEQGAKSSYRNSGGFVPGQAETIDILASTRLDQQLGFPAHSVMIDNPTTQWFFLQSAQRFVAPGLMNAVWQIPKASTQAQGQWRAPSPVAQAGLGTANQITLTFCEAYLMPSPGVIIPSLAGATGATEVVISDDAGNELLLNTAAQLGGLSATGSVPVAPPGEWSLTAAPAANVVASVTKAGVAGLRHFCRGITGDFVAGAVAPGAAFVLLVLRDGAAGVGAILWSRYLAVQAVAGDKDDTTSPPLNIAGTPGNAMTLEFTAAGGANTLEALSLNGYDAT